MRITRLDAIPIKLPRAATHDENRRSDDLVELGGDYVIAGGSWTSIYPRHLETTLVRVETDTGLVGWGEAFSPVARRTTQTIVEDMLRLLVVGQDPQDVEYIWYRCYSAMRERGHGTGFWVDALSGVDQAIWDVLGRAVGLPVHKLIGGRFRDRLKVYAGFGGTEPAALAEEAQRLVGQHGYTALKLHLRVASPRIVEIVTAVRERVGSDVDLMVDVHTTRDAGGAIALARALERLGVRWLEAPVAPEDVEGHAEVARAADLRIASGEWLRTAWEWRPWLEKRAVDVAMPDIGRTGISEGKRIAQLCDVHDVPVAPHIGAGCILAIAAGIQVSAAIARFDILEHSHDAMALKSSFARAHPEVVDGHVVLDDRPGLGVEIDEARVRALAG